MAQRSSLYILLLLLLISGDMMSQPYQADTSYFKMIAAGPQYAKPASFQHWWGKNRRKEWIVLLRVPIVNLDSIDGGLAPYKTGGGNETRSLKLRTATGKEYALRSINKSRKDVIPPYFANTFVANLIKDGVSMSHPYGAFALAYMEGKAGIPHTIPILVYIPKQSALDTFNKRYANSLYMIEQKPEGDWNESDNLGNFSSFASTEDVVKNILRDHHHLAIQSAYVRARLFDMLIADWDRHEDNWQWGKRKSGDLVTYIPVPKDRDQAFFKHDGVLIDFMIRNSGLGFMQNFDYSLKNMKTLNMEEKDIDRFFTNEMNKEDWIREARTLQQSLTDDVIERSVQQLAPEVFNISGKELIEKLKSRLNDLPRAATSYYDFLAKEVDVIGTEQRELFEVKKENGRDLLVTITRINNDDVKEDTPYYKRLFHPNETHQIRLYGMGGKDQFAVDNSANSIKIRIIGSRKDDSVQYLPKRIHFYEEGNKYFQSTSDRMKLSSDTEVIRYKYDWFNYNTRGFEPVISYNYEDRFYGGIKYQLKTYKWGRDPFSAKHVIGLNYSFSQKAISANYNGIIPNVIGHYNIIAEANYDAIQWTNFFGLGNHTDHPTKDIYYYRMHVRNLSLTGGLSREFGDNTIEAKAFFKAMHILQDSTIHAAKVFESSSNVFSSNQYAGLQLTYKFVSVDDSILPTRGITFITNGTYVRNITQTDFFQQYDARFQTYLPLNKKFSFILRVGGATIVGPASILNNALPMQHAIIGGPVNLRGYAFDRFWGRTSFYNNSEFRFITNLKSYVMNARIGMLAFLDEGRVWMPGESSTDIHTGYGVGVLFSPFHFFSCTLTYGISSESKLVQFKINTLF
jgi:hypothetical protein